MYLCSLHELQGHCHENGVMRQNFIASNPRIVKINFIGR